MDRGTNRGIKISTLYLTVRKMFEEVRIILPRSLQLRSPPFSAHPKTDQWPYLSLCGRSEIQVWLYSSYLLSTIIIAPPQCLFLTWRALTMAEAVKRRGEKRTSRYVSCKHMETQENKWPGLPWQHNRVQTVCIKSLWSSKIIGFNLLEKKNNFYIACNNHVTKFFVFFFLLGLWFSSFPTNKDIWGPCL